MRAAFARAIVDLAERDERLVLLTGDLGFTVLEPFAERFPDRFYNVGVAEQNMVGLATGLAEAGFIPYVYSIATFATMRPYEQIRNGPLLHELPVRVVGVGGGLDYAHNGVTHYALEDVALMRAQPRMTVVAPADPAQTTAALELVHELPGAAYVRLGRQSVAVPGLDGRIRLGRLERLGEGEDLALFGLGSLAVEAVAAAELLAAEGVRSTVGVAATLSPPPIADLAELLASVPLAVSVEAHYLNGGLGSLLAEVIAEHGLACRLVRCAVRRMPVAETGSPAFLHALHGLTGEQVAGAARSALEPIR